MFFVYILKSKIDSSLYIGHTSDLKARIKAHNSSSSKYSKTKKPFIIIWYCVFNKKTKAIKFEKYLKHGSGHAFMNKRLV